MWISVDVVFNNATWLFIDAHTIFNLDCATLGLNDTVQNIGFVLYPNPASNYKRKHHRFKTDRYF